MDALLPFHVHAAANRHVLCIQLECSFRKEHHSIVNSLKAHLGNINSTNTNITQQNQNLISLSEDILLTQINILSKVGQYRLILLYKPK